MGKHRFVTLVVFFLFAFALWPQLLAAGVPFPVRLYIYALIGIGRECVNALIEDVPEE